MAEITRSLVENGVAINLIVVDEDNLPVLADGQTLEDPAEYPYSPNFN
jgi:hypothetical protein